MAGIWVVGQVKQLSDRLAVDNVSRQGFDCYLPMTAEMVAPRGDPKYKLVVGRALFPGYMFVDIENRRWQSLLSTKGLWGLVGVGPSRNYPSVLPDGTVEELRSKEDNQGLVALPKLPSFEKGQEIRISEGHFQGRKGIYQGMTSKQRVEVLIDYLGRKTNVLIARDQVETV